MRSLDEIARAAQRGDTDALEKLLRAVQGDVWRFATYLTSANVGDDLAQESLVRVIEHLGRWHRGPVRAWILGVTRNVCREHIGRTTRRRTDPVSVPPDPAIPDQTGYVDAVALLSALAPEQGEAIVLTQLLGLSYAEAAEVADCAIGTIRSRVARGRSELTDAVSAEQGRDHG